MGKTGVIEPLGQDENIPAWCTPLVIVGKPDGNVRIYGRLLTIVGES